jgi:Tol biopolymer transport system component
MAIRRLSQTSDVVFASITPDGKSVIYNTINEDGDRTLWIRRVDDRNALKLLGPEPVQFWGGLVANEDTSQIYFVTANRAGSASALYRISALGGSPRKLADGVNDLGSLTADGKRILFVRYKDQLRIVSADADDGSNERVIREEDPTNTVYRDPQYSADGKLIYYSRMDRIDGIEWWQLVSIPADGGNETVIIPRRKEKINEIAVLNDGGGLLINGTDPTSFLSQLYFVSLPDGKLTRLTNDINSYFGISVDKAGRSIVAAERSDDKRVFVGEVGSLDQAQSITPEPNVFRLAEWTPDGRILYDATDNSRPHIWIADSDGANKQQLTPNESADMHPHASGDGKYIVFTSTRSGFDQVWRMNIDGSNPVLLADVEGATGAPRFAPDGHTVYFYWARGNESKMGRVDVTGGEVTELPRFSESEWAMSPDGSRMAYVIRDASNRTRLAIMRMDSPMPERVLDSSPIYLLEWSPDSESVLLREREEGTNPYSTIVEQNLVTGKRSIYLSTAPDYVIDLSFSRDGKRAAMVRGRLSTDAVMLTAPGP